MRSLESAAKDALDRRLLRNTSRPLAVALSGGGDSVALTLLADAWARSAGRELMVFHVDHRLQAASADWAEAAAALARRLGRPFRLLRWESDKPASGLPAAARAARHRLLADAARETGAGVILMGHTGDDLAEAAVMRADGSTTPSPRVWAPSPAWPEGRGVFVLRPLLGLRRSALRDWLAARGEPWIDDPANDDPRYARSRARGTAACPSTAPAPPPLELAREVEEVAGGFRLSRDALRAAAPDELRRLLAVACVCAGGGDGRPAAARTARLAEALRSDRPLTATLAGARVVADRDVLIAREAGEAARGGLAAVELQAGTPVVWDGRFEITATRFGLRVERLAGRQGRLSAEARRRLAALPAPFRSGLPAVVTHGGEATCPLLEQVAGLHVRALAAERLRAASGLADRERA